MSRLYTVLALVIKVLFGLVFFTGFLLLSAVIWVLTAGLYLRKWYWAKRYG